MAKSNLEKLGDIFLDGFSLGLKAGPDGPRQLYDETDAAFRERVQRWVAVQDTAAIASDWKAVGDDLRQAMGEADSKK